MRKRAHGHAPLHRMIRWIKEGGRKALPYNELQDASVGADFTSAHPTLLAGHL
jgi:hypothetical protein